MQNGNVLCSNLPFFALTGPRYSNRSIVFAALPSALRRSFPGIEFVFCSPFVPELTCPLLFSEQEWDDHPTTRLIGDWCPLDRVSHKVIRPARARNAVAVSLGFGLDAVLHAGVMPNFEIDDENINEVFRVQGGMVGVRTDEQHQPAPFYFVMDLDPVAINERMAEVPQLAAIPSPTRLKFIRYEQELIKRYEERVPHQKGFHHVRSSSNVTDMVSQIIPVMRPRIQAWQQAAAVAA